MHIGPVVSVVMSVHDGQAYLQDAVSSILTQSLHEIEFIIVDDGSSDGTWNLLTAINDPRVHLLQNPANAGIARSLNRGLEIATGRYVARQDADDISTPNRLEEQVAYFDAHPKVGLLGTDFLPIDESGRIFYQDHLPLPTGNANIRRQLLEANCFCHGSVMIRRSCVEKVGLYNPKYTYSQDYDLWLRLAEVTEIENLANVLYLQRQHAGSVSRRYHSRQIACKAGLLEDAARRRQGTDHAPPRPERVAQFYLQAAVAHHTAGEIDDAQVYLRRALAGFPTLFTDVELVATAFSPYEPVAPKDAVDFVDQVFADLLPAGVRWRALQRKLAGQLYMRAVFGGLAEDDWARVDQHLWPGLRRDPTWLLNRGVLIAVCRDLLWRMAHGRTRRRSGPKGAER